MDLNDALATAERNVLAAFQRCVALPGATRREVNALNEQLESLREALRAAPTDGRRLELLQSAARVFNNIAKKGPLHG
jgi:hypothetical protein